MPYETLEMAIQMAKKCQDPKAAVVFFASFSDHGYMRSLFVFYEINIQFLLLYLLSKAGKNLADSVSKVPEAQDVVTKFNNPSIKARYFMRPNQTDDNPMQVIAPRRKFERVVSSAASLSSVDITHLFEVDLKNQGQESCGSTEFQTKSDVFTQFIHDLETEEVDVEDMMLTLASENLGFGTCEEAGIIPSLEYLGSSDQSNFLAWGSFPFSMWRLEVAAGGKEAVEGHE
ncbi:hypothetical protein FAGAP_1380 [Fusarium agapanthi]|uniref:Uncharacterized protein n=1 Tax=Fusarium agapanthi TaxID=1803897 RepID=A0A9P5BHN0_9HYPO|nr:hypothetical protein FAGAP_1380 [Fusarium agapanthi]